MNANEAIEKIRKCLAIASDPGASPNEAESASRQAARLMAKFDLDAAEVNLDAVGADDIKFKFGRAKARHLNGKTGRAPLWTQTISVGLGKLFKCKVEISKDLEADKDAQDGNAHQQGDG
jgi:hypothetical protein